MNKQLTKLDIRTRLYEQHLRGTFTWDNETQTLRYTDIFPTCVISRALGRAGFVVTKTFVFGGLCDYTCKLNTATVETPPSKTYDGKKLSEEIARIGTWDNKGTALFADDGTGSVHYQLTMPQALQDLIQDQINSYEGWTAVWSDEKTLKVSYVEPKPEAEPPVEQAHFMVEFPEPDGGLHLVQITKRSGLMIHGTLYGALITPWKNDLNNPPHGWETRRLYSYDSALAAVKDYVKLNGGVFMDYTKSTFGQGVDCLVEAQMEFIKKQIERGRRSDGPEGHTAFNKNHRVLRVSGARGQGHSAWLDDQLKASQEKLDVFAFVSDRRDIAGTDGQMNWTRYRYPAAMVKFLEQTFMGVKTHKRLIILDVCPNHAEPSPEAVRQTVIEWFCNQTYVTFDLLVVLG